MFLLVPSPLAAPAWRCFICSHALAGRRAFNSSSASLQSVSPESPNFIEVPQPLQPRAPYHPPIKGTLPTPRSIFGPSGAKTEKVSSGYLDAVTKEPIKDANAAPHGERTREAWKERMATARRRNLREGITELYKRRVQTDKILTTRTQKRQVERQRLIDKPQREDERLTNPTVLVSTKEFGVGIVADPAREARVAQKRQVVQQQMMRKEEGRRDALHTLYMQARDFITSEEQLNTAIEQVFGTPENPARWNNGKGDSIWYEGKPDAMQDLLDRVNRTGTLAMEANEGHAALTAQRIKRIAEELTGGKL